MTVTSNNDDKQDNNDSYPCQETHGGSQHPRRKSSFALAQESTIELYNKIDDKLDAYERKHVPADRYKGWLSFLGLFTSRHTAGTEFAIGPLFVARGSTAIDILVGLFIGNLLATLSWRFIAAPLAVSKRMTTYYSMERVVGRKLMIIYDLLSCVLLAGLAGAMFTVSATAFAAMFNVDSPELTDLLPSSGLFCGIVIVCGLVTTIVAAVGFSFVTVFGQIMTPVLFAGIIYLFINSLQMLGFGDDDCGIWCILSERVYTGSIVEGQTKFGMAHCIFFSWFVDLQLHIGQNDLSLLRFARSANIGWTSAGGMYIGHYFAWIVAGCMYAVQLEDDPENTSVAPGPIAKLVGGNFGLVVIIIAGWSTANPVIYSSGLALQHIYPKIHAWLSTLIVGLVATAVACFPAITNQIIEFLALSGIILCPMGVILFTDHFVVPKIDGLCSEFSYQHRLHEDSCHKTNLPAVITWASAEIISLPLALLTPVSVYFAPVITIPYSFFVYIILSKIFVNRGWIEYKEEKVLAATDNNIDANSDTRDGIHSTSTEIPEIGSMECEV